MGDTVCEPFVAFVPDHPPDAVQAVALVDDQVNVALEPDMIDAGFAEIVTVGAGPAGDVTVTLVDCDASPPAPVHESEYVTFEVGDTDCEPLVAFEPLHPFEATQDVASVDDHIRVALEPN